MTDLYRFYDADGALLYVGISYSAIVRLAQHRADKSWWDDVARVDIEKHPTREVALEAERRAIVEEKPRHNVVHNGLRRAPDERRISFGFSNEAVCRTPHWQAFMVALSDLFNRHELTPDDVRELIKYAVRTAPIADCTCDRCRTDIDEMTWPWRIDDTDKGSIVGLYDCAKCGHPYRVFWSSDMLNLAA